MLSRFERTVAWRYLRSPRQKGFISVIAGFSFVGIMLGVATLIVVMSVMNGFSEEFLRHIIGVNGHLWVYHPVQPLEDYEQLRQEIAAKPGVVLAIPTIERQVIVTFRTQARGVSVHGISAKDLQQLTLVAQSLPAETLQKFSGNTIIIGTRLAEKLQLRPGDKLNLISPDGTPTAFGTLPRQRTFAVGGLFEVGMNQFDQGVIFMPLATAQDFFKLANKVTALEITLNKASNSEQMIHTLGPRYPRLAFMDWQHANTSFMQARKVERNVMFLILTLIILIAAFNIISGLIMLVKDKTRDIAIMRTMGASKSSIMKIFCLSGVTLGVGGTASGVMLGLVFALNIESIRRLLEKFTGGNLFNEEIYFLAHLPAKVDLGEVGQVVLLALTLAFLATLYPAWSAAKLDPVEALRR